MTYLAYQQMFYKGKKTGKVFISDSGRTRSATRKKAMRRVKAANKFNQRTPYRFKFVSVLKERRRRK